MLPAELGGRLRPAAIVVVIGTRPEAIKLAPVVRALAHLGWRPDILLTGQHPALDPAEHGFERLALADLSRPGGRSPQSYAAATAHELAAAIGGDRPLVVVQGDTASAMAGALAAEAVGARLAHVEAGLRSHDPARPWPEEGFRIAIDRMSNLLFAPTLLSAANLRREEVRGEVHVTGNTAIDALLAARPGPRRMRFARQPARILVTCHRRESWGAGVRSIAAALGTLAGDGRVSVDIILHPNPAAADWRPLSGIDGVRLHPPCSHREMIEHMLASDLLLSDSGGIQEEAAALGIPLLVLRNVTERPEGIASGNMVLVGTGRDRIVGEVRRLIGNPRALEAMSRPALPFGDGDAAGRIAAIIDRRLGGVGLSAGAPAAA